MEDRDVKDEYRIRSNRPTTVEHKKDNLKEEQNDDLQTEKKGANQFELFENKLRSILFPEPIFSQYITELKTKPSKPVNFPCVDTVLDESGLKSDTRSRTGLINRPQYTRYLRTWKKNIVHSDKLTSYLSNLRELHLAKLITFIEQMHKNSQYTDLDLYVDDLCFPVHRIILACYAPFIFQKLERTKRKQHQIEKLRLVNIDAQSFSTIIGFMYTGIAQPNETNFLPVLNTAIHLFMFEFANAWVELYEHKFTNRTAQMLFRSNIARHYGWSDYIQMLNLALAFDFEHLLVSDQFEDICFEQLRDIIQMDNIGALSEVVLYLAVLKWLSFNLEQRKQHSLELMRLIRFTNMNENELYACYNPPILPEVIEQPEVKAMMADAFNSLVQQNRTGEDNLNEMKRKRTFRLANSYKGEPLQLWCNFNEKKRKNLRCPPMIKQLKELKGLKQFKENRIKTDQSISDQTSDSDAIRTQLDDSFKYTSSDSTNITSPPTSNPLDQAVRKDDLNARSDTSAEKSTTSTDSSQQIYESKLSVIKHKPRLDDVACLCKEVKHTSVKQCKQERAAQIIQRTFRRYLETKSKRTSQMNGKRKKLIPKIKTKFLGKNIVATKQMDKRIDRTESDEDKTVFLDEQKSAEILEPKFMDATKSKMKRKTDKKRRTNAKNGAIKTKEINFAGSNKSQSQESISKSKDEERAKEKLPDKMRLDNESTFLTDNLAEKESTPFTLSHKSNKEERTTYIPSTSGLRPLHSVRVGQFALYSDSINQEFCGFYICSGINRLDGQLLDWQKGAPFNNRKSNKVMLPLYDAVVVSHGPNIYLVGGMQTASYKNFYVSKQIIKYQLTNRKFQSSYDLATPRIQHSCVVAGDRLYVICGCKKLNSPVNTVECIHLMSNRKQHSNSEILKLPGYGRFGQSAVYFRSRLWIIGGIAKIDNNFHLLSEVWILDVVQGNKWIKAKFPVPIAFAGICSVNEEFIYVVGGRCVGLNGKLQPSEKVWCYNVGTKRWQQIASLKEPRCNCCCVLFENRIYTFGGSLENDVEHLRGQTGEFYDLNNPNQGWKLLNKNLPISIAGQSVTVVSNF